VEAAGASTAPISGVARGWEVAVGGKVVAVGEGDGLSVTVDVAVGVAVGEGVDVGDGV
jgi:hypothetical protein